jgi:Rieske Fe-S protein
VTQTGYVALSGSCTHNCCDNDPPGSGGPTHMPVCQVIADAANPSGLACQAPPDAGASADASSDASVDASTDAGGGASSQPQPGQILKDMIFCTCHGSMFSAVTGALLNSGPASVGLPLLDVCVGGGYVFVTIPPS